ncbi:MAG: hypothetical protein B6U78_01845 [Candidatus Aenigmarchaeota archaeon ex4484_224]|nr:MAG: hypothetical protein B6U78_01845 [Candidatus Aenigmarchaeota archaeon ex4484_224]
MEIKEFLIGLIIGFFISFSFLTYQTYPKTEVHIIPTNFSLIKNYSIKFSGESEIYLPAVDQKGNGVITKLKVRALPGNGRVLVDINQLLFWIDTQQSIQIAKRVAQQITGLDLSKYDLFYSIETNASIIEGPSAGAGITIATIAALENKTLNKSVMITGTIQPDGSIGPVGGIEAKARAAKQIGAKVFLVPRGQGTQVTYVPIKNCKTVGYVTFCEITYKLKETSISKKVGIEVKEVENIYDALNYFFS